MGSKTGLWKSHLAAWRDSGLSQSAYCRRHGLSLPCFGYWRSKLHAAWSPPALSENALLPIVVAEVAMSDDRIEVALPNGLQVRVSVGLDPQRLVPMIQALIAC